MWDGGAKPAENRNSKTKMINMSSWLCKLSFHQGQTHLYQRAFTLDHQLNPEELNELLDKVVEELKKLNRVMRL
jgi:hypothetical protein